jgi:hypothetical protein
LGILLHVDSFFLVISYYNFSAESDFPF